MELGKAASLRVASPLVPCHPFLELAERQFASADVDVGHPLYLELARTHKLDREQTIWLITLHMAHHDEGSAWAAFRETEPFGKLRTEFPIESARRNLFGGRIHEHLASVAALVKHYGGGEAWLTNGFTGDAVANWRRLLTTIRGAWGNGRWAAYTMADMLQKVGGLNVYPPDLENEESTGPAVGLQHLFGKCSSVSTLNDYATRAFGALQAHVHARTAYLPAGHLDMAMLESLLCQWSSLCRGAYYSGRNIDRQQERIVKVMMRHGLMLTEMWEAREGAFKREHLGECSGWAGIDKPRLAHFARTGNVLWSHERR